MRCPKCSAEFTIKTDPKNSDYNSEVGCSRNFEPWREKEKQIQQAKQERAKEEEGDTMKALENRTLDSKIEMDILEALDEIRALNARNARLKPEELIEIQKRKYQQMLELDERDEDEINTVVFKNSNDFVKRVDLNELADEDNDEDLPTKKAKNSESQQASNIATTSLNNSKPSSLPSSNYVKVLPIPQRTVIAKKKPLITITPVKKNKGGCVDY